MWPVYVPSLTALMVALLTLKVLCAALTLPSLLARKSRIASTFSKSSAGGLPPVRPSAFGRGAVHAGLDPVPDRLPLPLGQGEEHVEHGPSCGTVVSGVQSLAHSADVDPLLVDLLDGLEPI